MKATTLVVLLCLAALRASAQDVVVDGNIEFLPPDTDTGGQDPDKDAPTPRPEETLPTTTFDPDKVFGNDKPTSSPVVTTKGPAPLTSVWDKDTETSSGGGPVDLVPARTSAPPTTTQAPTTTRAVVSSENCTNVRCALDVLQSCPKPVVLPGRCCPSCPNLTVCSGVRCPCGSVCSEHNGRAICCKKHAESYYSRNTHRRLRKAFVAVNKYGDSCTLRYEPHQYVRVCTKANCTRNETCYPSRGSVATCCPLQMGRKPVCYVTHPKLLGNCQVPPVGTPEEQNCTCRLIMSLQRRYPYPRFGRGRHHHHRHRRSHFRSGGHHDPDHQEHESCRQMAFVHMQYNRQLHRHNMYYCKGPVNKCHALVGGRQSRRQSFNRHRHRRGAYSGLFHGLLRHVFGRRSSRMVCRRVNV